MTESNKLDLICNYLYYARHISCLGNKLGRGRINYSHNNVFNKYLEVSLQGNKWDVPVAISGNVFSPRIQNLYGKKVLVPLYLDNALNSVKSAYMGVKILSSHRSSNSSRLVEVVVPTKGIYKGVHYYGFNGIIFNSDMIPLILTTYSIVTDNIDMENDDLEKSVTGIKAYVHPNVFYSKNPIEKYIARKVIPHMLEHRNSPSNSYATIIKSRPDIIISESIEDFIVAPINPEVAKEDPNMVLKRHIDEVLANIRSND